MKTAYHTGQYVVFLKRPRIYRRVRRCRMVSDLIDAEKKPAAQKRNRQHRKETGSTEKEPADRRGNGRRKTPFGLLMAALYEPVSKSDLDVIEERAAFGKRL